MWARIVWAVAVAGTAIGLSGAAPAGAAGEQGRARGARVVNVPRLLAPQIAAVKQAHPDLAVLVPTTLALSGRQFPSGGARPGGYLLQIDAARNCHEATACFLAELRAQRSGKLVGRRIRLEHGIRGIYRGIQCGASCSPAQVDWIEGGVLYSIQANVDVTAGSVRSTLVGAADQAIKAGPR